MNDTSPLEELQDWITAGQLSEENPAFSIGWIRHRLFHRKENGLAPYVKKIGRRILISRKGFVKWFKDNHDDEGICSG